MTQENYDRLEKRVTELELIVSYQDELVETLSHQLYEHNQNFEALNEAFLGLKDQVAQGTSTEVDNRRPPHY